MVMWSEAPPSGLEFLLRTNPKPPKHNLNQTNSEMLTPFKYKQINA